MAQIISITSEALQATIRRLLPSQQGFGEDLQASNVITPVINLTPTAEGSVLDSDLARAITFDSQSAFQITGTVSTTIVNTTGFHRIFGNASLSDDGSTDVKISFVLTDGLATKTVLEYRLGSGSGNEYNDTFDFIAFFNPGESLYIQTNNGGVFATGSTRQVADVNGNLIQPAGFVFE